MQVRDIGERKCIEMISSYLDHPSFKKNRINASDSEIIDLGLDCYIAVTIDSISDTSDLFPDITPFQIGWTAVNVSISDLAAVGAKPVGMLLSWEVDRKTDLNKVEEISKGINAAIRYHGAFILGGDLNDSESGLHLTGCAIGLVEKDRLLTREGATPGDIVAVTGDIGGANAGAISIIKNIALNQQHKDALSKKLYTPTARLKESEIISRYATSCIDLSDGLYSGLYELMRVNGIGFQLFNEDFYMQEAMDLMADLDYPVGILGAGGAGDYELLFTVNEKRLPALISEFRLQKMKATPIGRVQPDRKLLIESDGRLKEINIPFFEQFKFDLGDLDAYLKGLLSNRSLY